MTAVIFDLDGTLVESAPVIQGVANQLMTEIGHRPLGLDEVHNFVGDGTVVFLERTFQALNKTCSKEEFTRHHNRLLELHAAVPGSASRPMAGAGESLHALYDIGCAIGMCTNKPAVPTQNILEAHDWAPMFSAVIAGDTMPERKPDPAPLREAARLLGTSPAIFVGDSDVDAATAEAAGMAFLLFTEGYRDAAIDDLTWTATFSHFSELPDLVRKVADGALV